VLDLANDLPNSFAGGEMNIDPEKGRITLGGKWGSRYGSRHLLSPNDLRLILCSFGPGSFNYQAFACYDLLNGGKQQLSEYGVWTGDTWVFI